MELVFRLIPPDVRQEKAQQYFSSNSVAQAFSDITSSEFEAVSSKFTIIWSKHIFFLFRDESSLLAQNTTQS